MAVIWTSSLVSNGNNFQNYCIRNRCGPISAGGNQVRVRFVASGTQVMIVDNASIGVLGGATAPNCTTNPPVRLTFSGANGFSIAAGASITSDWVNLTFLSSDAFIVDHDFNSTASGHKEGGGNTGSLAYFRAAYDGYNLATVTGFSASSAGYVRGIDQIEGQTVSSVVPYNFPMLGM